MARKAASSSTPTKRRFPLRRKRAAIRSRADRYESLRDKPPRHSRAASSSLLGNIELAQEAAHCLDRGAEGVGLYRTEFLYLNKTADPTEDEHYEAYKSSTVRRSAPTGR